MYDLIEIKGQIYIYIYIYILRNNKGTKYDKVIGPR